MTESKIDLTDRLRREKRWEEASQYKDTTAKQLRSEGMKRGDANAAAWGKMAEKYPPLETSESDETFEPEQQFSPEQIAGLPAGSLQNFSADATWVYGSLQSGDTGPESAPSAGASTKVPNTSESADETREEM